NIDSSSDAILEYERLMRLNEDIIRFLTIRIYSVDEKPSPLMNNKTERYKNEKCLERNCQTCLRFSSY
ncbi:MAG: hypothetical protein CMQ54_05495, partial [Gammaproteobacteria bacterium]|nr:hypothetical protein [Gammaproteobacteria bacterium]